MLRPGNRAANDGSVPEEKLRAAFTECWRVAFDAVADKYGFTEAMRAAGWQVFRQTEVTEPMYGGGGGQSGFRNRGRQPAGNENDSGFFWPGVPPSERATRQIRGLMGLKELL